MGITAAQGNVKLNSLTVEHGEGTNFSGGAVVNG